MTLAPATPRRRPALPAALERHRHPVAHYVARRVGAGFLTLLAFSVVVFLATSVLPGDAASAILGKNATGPQLRELRELMGLDVSLPEQYWTWISGLVQGDLGNSAAGYAAGGEVSIAGQIGDKLVNSLVLAGLAFWPIVILSIAVGVLTALYANRWPDHLLSGVTLLPAALPEFVLGALLLAVFFSALDVLPPVSIIPAGQSALSSPEQLVLPVLTLVGVTVGAAARMVRAGMLESLAAPSVDVARLNGISERRVVSHYALRNALGPSVQVLSLVAQYLVGGVLIVEYLFACPGIGKELIDAISINDNLAVQSVTMILAAVVIAITIIADVLVLLLDPKLRSEAL